MAGGTFPRSFERMLGRSRSVAATSMMKWSERSGGGGAARRTPTSVANGEGGTLYTDTETSPDGFSQVSDLIDVVIPGPGRIAYLYVTLTGFLASYDGNYLVTHLANIYLGMVTVQGSAVGGAFPVLVGNYTGSTVFRVATPSDEGTVTASLWVPEA